MWPSSGSSRSCSWPTCPGRCSGTEAARAAPRLDRAGAKVVSQLLGVGVVLGTVAEELGGVAQVPAHPAVVRHAVGDDEETLAHLGLDGTLEQADEVGVGQPHRAGPLV